jgi:hypothetical protein
MCKSEEEFEYKKEVAETYLPILTKIVEAEKDAELKAFFQDMCDIYEFYLTEMDVATCDNCPLI